MPRIPWRRSSPRCSMRLLQVRPFARQAGWSPSKPAEHDVGPDAIGVGTHFFSISTFLLSFPVFTLSVDGVNKGRPSRGVGWRVMRKGARVPGWKEAGGLCHVLRSRNRLSMAPVGHTALQALQLMQELSLSSIACLSVRLRPHPSKYKTPAPRSLQASMQRLQ